MTENAPGARIRVLYAEDSPLDADLARVHFESEARDLELVVEPTGASTLKRLEREDFDVILLDNRLPDTDGVDVLRTLVHRGATVPVVLVTGLGDEALVVTALRLGARDYVPKRSGYLDGLPDTLRRVVAETRERRARGEGPFPRPRTVLYVEHLPMDVDLMTRHLGEVAPHLTVHHRRLAAEALELLSGPHEFDVVLLDFRMPDVSGLELVHELRRRKVGLPPFILLSGRGDDAAVIGALRLGASDYITKQEGYLDHAVHAIERAIAVAELERTVTALRAELAERARLETRTREQLDELRRWHDATLGREDRILALKREVNEALARWGLPPRYASAGPDSG